MDNLIDLYYIDGISKNDTPYFSSKQDQLIYFAQHSRVLIESSYYPAFFNDTIKFENDDLDVNVHVNYLSIYYNNKYYYYFINSIRYSSRGVIECDIEMDVIQTYMFNFSIKNGIIERKFINRWNGDNFARNYIRENLSNGNFTRTSKRYYNNGVGWLVIKTIKTLFSYPTDDTMAYATDDNFGVAPYNYYFTPIGDSDSYLSIEGVVQSGVVFNSSIVLRNMVGKAEVVGIYVCPYNDFLYGIVGSNITNPSMYKVVKTNYASGDKAVILLKGDSNSYGTEKINSLIKRIPFIVGFIKNIEKGKNFISDYCPVMCDENYKRVYFGDNGAQSTFPLHNVKTTGIYFNTRFFVLSGYRSYFISLDDTDDFSADFYNTIATNYSTLSYDLANDPWNNYLAYNKFSVVSGILKDVTNIAGLFTYGTSKNLATNFNRIVNNKGKYGMTSLEGASDTLTSITSMANAYFSPSTVKLSGDYTRDYAAMAIKMYCCVDIVDDFDYCSLYYHKNGYLVNEMINNIPSNGNGQGLFDIINTRFYFNVIKMFEPSVHLEDMLEAENITNSIALRLSNGLRLWNVEDTGISIGDFTYDNVEKDYLE